MCVCVSIYLHGPENDVKSPGVTGATQCQCKEPNSGPSQEQAVRLTAEPVSSPKDDFDDSFYLWSFESLAPVWLLPTAGEQGQCCRVFISSSPCEDSCICVVGGHAAACSLQYHLRKCLWNAWIYDLCVFVVKSQLGWLETVGIIFLLNFFLKVALLIMFTMLQQIYSRILIFPLYSVSFSFPGVTVRVPQTTTYVVNNGLTLGSAGPQLTVHHRPPQVHTVNISACLRLLSD